MAVLVASSTPLDQFIVNHPEYFLSQPPEMGLINPDNIHILLSHLQCATFELPFGADERFGGHDVSEILEYLARARIHSSGREQVALDERCVSGGFDLTAKHQLGQFRGRGNHGASRGSSARWTTRARFRHFTKRRSICIRASSTTFINSIFPSGAPT